MFPITEQRAWRKRQLCYRLSERSSVFLAITDIIVMSKAKKAPEGFTMAGEVNGLLICYKSAPLPAAPQPLSSLVLPLQVNLKPTALEDQSLTTSSQPAKPLSPSHPAPVRPAPLPPISRLSPDGAGNRTIIVSAATLSGFTGKMLTACALLESAKRVNYQFKHRFRGSALHFRTVYSKFYK